MAGNNRNEHAGKANELCFVVECYILREKGCGCLVCEVTYLQLLLFNIE